MIFQINLNFTLPLYCHDKVVAGAYNNILGFFVAEIEDIDIVDFDNSITRH